MTFEPRDPRSQQNLPWDSFPLEDDGADDVDPTLSEDEYAPEDAQDAPGAPEAVPEGIFQPRRIDAELTEVHRRIAEFGRASGRVIPSRSLTDPAPVDDQTPFMRNPYVMAAIAVFGAIVLAVLFVFVFGSRSSHNASTSDDVSVAPLTPIAGQGYGVKTIAASTVRVGPGREYDAVGEISRNQDVEVIGRNTDNTWYAIYYPPGSELQGWVPGSALKLPADTTSLAVIAVSPIPRPTVIIPTAPPEPTQAATLTPIATVSATPDAGPDISVAVSCNATTPLVAIVTNRGKSSVENRTLRVIVAENGVADPVQDSVVTLTPGASITIPTTHVVRSHASVTANLLGSPPDANPGNNVADCAISVVPTPRPPLPSPTSGFPTPVTPLPIATRPPGT